jgi:hypothetical protein
MIAAKNQDQRRKDWLAQKAKETKKLKEDREALDECSGCGELYDTRLPHKCPEL